MSTSRRIELLATLGQGGFGAVYLADVHSRDDFVQRLAVKVLSAEMSADADIAARQRDEARLLARLNHDHIVRVVDLTEVDGRPAVLMEYVEGADASVLLAQGPVPLKAALQIGAAAASALDAAWSSPGPRTGQPLRVIHRDIKPANLLVSRHGGVKVLDFGIARGDFDREGRTGSVQFGTARFMAPEQWLYGQASNKVDVYALGVSMVELLTGAGTSRAPLQREAFDRHMAELRQALRRPEWPAGVARGLDLLLEGMLAFDPEVRPDAGDVYEALAHLVDEAPGEGLRRWARRVVPPVVEQQRARWAQVPLPRLGAGLAPVVVVVDDTASAPAAAASPSQAATALAEAPPVVDTLAQPRPAPGRWPLVAGLAALAAGVVVTLGIGTALWLRPTAPPETVLSDEAPSAPTGEEAPPVDVVEEVPPPAEQAPPPEAPPPTTQPPTTTRRRASGPAPEPVAATTAPAPEPLAEVVTEPSPVATVPITVSSTPWGAEIVVDGRPVGTTPMRNLPLAIGSHTLTMTRDGSSTSHTIEVGGRNPTAYSWTVESNEWRSSL